MSTTPSELPGLDDVDWTHYDFIDLGCSNGGSLAFCASRFEAQRGLGIDLSPRKVTTAREKGLDAVLGDARRLPAAAGVRFVSMMDFLEHLPDLATVESVIESAAQAATDFLFISHPSFEGEAYLERLGLRQYWWHWKGHPVHPTVSDYCDIFERLGLRLYTIHNYQRVADSSHPSVLPAGAPRDQGAYDETVHPPKPHVEFDMPIWRAQAIYVALRPFDPAGSEWESITTWASRQREAELAQDERRQ